jgi:hypothetical protein
MKAHEELLRGRNEEVSERWEGGEYMRSMEKPEHARTDASAKPGVSRWSVGFVPSTVV